MLPLKNKTIDTLEILLFHYDIAVELRNIIVSYALFDYKDPRLLSEENFRLNMSKITFNCSLTPFCQIQFQNNIWPKMVEKVNEIIDKHKLVYYVFRGSNITISVEDQSIQMYFCKISFILYVHQFHRPKNYLLNTQEYLKIVMNILDSVFVDEKMQILEYSDIANCHMP
jgi:hypothetical protein